MHAHHGVERSTQGVNVTLLAAGLPGARIQDVAPVQNQDQDVDLGGLRALLGGAVLEREGGKRERGRERRGWTLT